MCATDAKHEEESVNQSVESKEVTPDQVSQHVKKLETELEEEKKRSSELSKSMMYLQADMVNLQRQSDRKEAQAREDATLRYLLELISIEEDLERALSAAGEDVSRVIRDGLSMLISRIDSDLRAESVERIDAKTGSYFDPSIHEAIAYTESEGKKDGCVLSVVSNGYTYRGKVIKPALVEVAHQNPSSHGHRKEDQAHGTRNVAEQIKVGPGSVEEGPQNHRK